MRWRSVKKHIFESNQLQYTKSCKRQQYLNLMQHTSWTKHTRLVIELLLYLHKKHTVNSKYSASELLVFFLFIKKSDLLTLVFSVLFYNYLLLFFFFIYYKNIDLLTPAISILFLFYLLYIPFIYYKKEQQKQNKPCYV